MASSDNNETTPPGASIELTRLLGFASIGHDEQTLLERVAEVGNKVSEAPPPP